MTEADWLACGDPMTMLDALRGRASERKLRLFAVACCRGIWHLLADERSRAAIAVIEQYADGLVGRERLVAARDGAREAKRRFPVPAQVRAWRAAGAVQDATRDMARSAALNSAAESGRAMDAGDTNHWDAEAMRSRAALLRCIVGNPFRPETEDPAWMTPSVVALAKAIYDERAFDRLDELADTLQGAGCNNAAFLAHCRDPGEHARGCWVVDSILRKA
jgi:hypothetical protein